MCETLEKLFHSKLIEMPEPVCKCVCCHSESNTTVRVLPSKEVELPPPSKKIKSTMRPSSGMLHMHGSQMDSRSSFGGSILADDKSLLSSDDDMPEERIPTAHRAMSGKPSNMSAMSQIHGAKVSLREVQ